MSYLWPGKWKDRRVALRIAGPPWVDKLGEPDYATPTLGVRFMNEELFCNCDANDMVNYVRYHGELLAGLVLEGTDSDFGGVAKSFRVLHTPPQARPGTVRRE